MSFGYELGETCNRPSDDRTPCSGVIKEYEVENCSCHTDPPCYACTEDAEYCPECGWQAKDDKVINDRRYNFNPSTGVVRFSEKRPLSKTSIDWHSLPHSGCSMVKEGVHPEGTTQKEVLEKVKGTFGGRFEQFGNGRFRYIAYTD